MNRTATSEGRKAAEAVRDANRQLIEEMSQAVSEASRKFADATKEMRESAQELQRDLAAAREEMKRGVLELPEETRESTDAMRRVVSDQIRALSELSEIITRHGKTLDLSSPALGEPRHTPLRTAEIASAVGAEMAGSMPHGETSAPSRNSEGRRPLANGGAREARSTQPSAKSEQAKPVPVRQVQQRPAPQRPVAPTGAGEDRGWVSDLLRRASRDDEGAEDDGSDGKPIEVAATPVAPSPASGNGQRPQAGSSGPLNVLAADIAKAIDHDASVELWERHRRGEHNVFTRRLYTLQGQQTFDEIRKKYQRDKDFRAAVDRYVTDFEKLLAEVTRNDGDRAAGNSYLTSDTGKVYTMLAHASGRFD
jgi:hypothetical protein